MSKTLVQSNSAQSNVLENSHAVTLLSGITRGNLVVATVGVGNNAATITGPTGWSMATINQPSGTSATIETSIWWTVVSSSQAGQKSWTWSISGSPHTFYIGIEEWNSSNGWPANPLDKTANGDTGTPSQVTTILSGTTATTTQAAELWIGSLAYKGSAQAESSITAGWTKDVEASLAFNNTMTMLYNVAIATGAAAVQYTIGSAAYWAGCVATFKDNASVSPILQTTPATMSFTATVGGSNPPSQNDTLAEVAGSATSWTSSISYHQGSGWLSISPSSGSLGASGTATINVSCTTGALNGTYTATITFTATTGGSTATIDVTFVVASPTLAASPGTLSFTGTVNSPNPTSKPVTLSETAGVGTAWTASLSGAGATFISLTPSSGTLLANGQQNVTVQPTTGSLAVGTYNTTLTFTASTGGGTATVAITVVMLATNSIQILLAGQDITSTVEQLSIDAIDALGQGNGAGAAPTFQGRQSTIKFNTSMGPANSALGAGQTIPNVGGPYLVRQGQLLIKNANGVVVWAGYATKLTDITTGTYARTSVQPFTTIEGTDYDAALDRVLINNTYTAMTDVQIIQAIITQYAPFVDLSLLPAVGNFVFPVKTFRNISVQRALRTIAGITGYMIWVDFQYRLNYAPVSAATNAPFGLSDTPDFLTKFPHNVQEFVLDDNSVINRVFFYGGRHNSGDFTQDVSPLANGNNKVFPLAYYPHPSSTGAYIVTVNSVSQVVGDVNGATTPANTFKSAGGLADVLMNSDAHAITFDVAPASGATVKVTYQYDYPLTLVTTSQASYNFFGPPYLDGYVSDSTVFDIPTALQRSKVLLAQQSFGLITLKVDCWQPGLRAGMTVNITNTVRGINAAYLVQQVEMEPLGGGTFVYHLTLGAWDWNLLDIMMQLAHAAQGQDTQQAETIEQVDLNAVNVSVNIVSTWTASGTLHSQPYYARASAVGDGHDAYPGFATISS